MLAALALWAVWYVYQTQVYSGAGPVMSPQEISAAFIYAFGHPPPLTQEELYDLAHPLPQPTRAELEAQSLAELEAQRLAELEAQRLARQELRAQQWAELQAQYQAAQLAQAEQQAAEVAAIERDFPVWLRDLAERRNIKRDTEGLQALANWIDRLLAYGQTSGYISVRLLFRAFAKNAAAPANAASWDFFTDLLKVLESQGFLGTRAGDKGGVVRRVLFGLSLKPQEFPETPRSDDFKISKAKEAYNNGKA